MLSTGEIKDCHLAPRDLKVARELFGDCNDCLRGKMKAPDVPATSNSPPADNIGSHWSADFFFVKRKGGSSRPILLFTEEKTGLDVAYVMRTRSSREIQRVGKQFQSFLKNFRLPSDVKTVIVTDHEVTFSKLEDGLKWAEVTQSAPDQHAKRAEKKIDTIKRKMSAILVSLPYKLPFSLYTDLARDVIMKINFTPNSNSGERSPIRYDTIREQRSQKSPIAHQYCQSQ